MTDIPSNEFQFPNEFARLVFERKYAGENGTIDDLYNYAVERISNVVRHDINGKAGAYYEEVLYNLKDSLFDGRFIFGGRIMAAFGNPHRKVSYFNCTNINIQEDSIEGIGDAMTKVMRVSSRGQGVGIDFSKLRPRGAPVNNAAYSSTGSVSFMELFDKLGGVIAQDGDSKTPARRMAMLFTLDCSHPDVIEFIHCKQEKDKITNANISVVVSEKFLHAVEYEQDWDLVFNDTVYRTLPAKELWDMIIQSNMISAEPGVLFIENAKKTALPEWLGYPIVGFNACTEASLDYAGVCNLGSINLGRYVFQPEGEDRLSIDWLQLQKDVEAAVVALDAIISLEINEERFPIKEQLDSQKGLRRIGVGVMGLADMLALLGIEYGSSEAKKITNITMKAIAEYAYLSSAALAMYTEPCEAIKNYGLSNDGYEGLTKHPFIAKLGNKTKQAIATYGLRNAAILSVAPTGSISNILGASSGIEPLFRKEYTRWTRLNGDWQDYHYIHPVFEANPDAAWVESNDILPQNKLEMVAAAQEWVCQSISNTGNFPSNTTPEDLSKYYRSAFVRGLKGLTVYVDNAETKEIRGAVLTEVETETEEVPEIDLYQGSACFINPETGETKCD